MTNHRFFREIPPIWRFLNFCLIMIVGQLFSEEDRLFIKKGEMTNDPFTMTGEELTAWKERSRRETSERLFAIGQPLVYKTNGHFVAEYADGTIKRL